MTDENSERIIKNIQNLTDPKLLNVSVYMYKQKDHL